MNDEQFKKKAVEHAVAQGFKRARAEKQIRQSFRVLPHSSSCRAEVGMLSYGDNQQRDSFHVTYN